MQALKGRNNLKYSICFYLDCALSGLLLLLPDAMGCTHRYDILPFQGWKIEVCDTSVMKKGKCVLHPNQQGIIFFINFATLSFI
jgi:hypothetical protein